MPKLLVRPNVVVSDSTKEPIEEEVILEYSTRYEQLDAYASFLRCLQAKKGQVSNYLFLDNKLSLFCKFLFTAFEGLPHGDTIGNLNLDFSSLFDIFSTGSVSLNTLEK